MKNDGSRNLVCTDVYSAAHQPLACAQHSTRLVWSLFSGNATQSRRRRKWRTRDKSEKNHDKQKSHKKCVTVLRLNSHEEMHCTIRIKELRNFEGRGLSYEPEMGQIGNQRNNKWFCDVKKGRPHISKGHVAFRNLTSLRWPQTCEFHFPSRCTFSEVLRRGVRELQILLMLEWKMAVS